VAQQAEPLLGCVKPGTGLLRVVQPGETCKGQETPLGFNDLPLLVALRNTVLQLQARVEALEERVETLEACAAQLCGGE
jgi:hypothetical protein